MFSKSNTCVKIFTVFIELIYELDTKSLWVIAHKYYLTNYGSKEVFIVTTGLILIFNKNNLL